jgi:hypothetical protein
LASVLVPNGAEAPTQRGGRAARSVAGAVTGLVRDGLAALRPAPVYETAPATKRGLFRSAFDLLAAPLVTAAVGTLPAIIRESREADRQRQELRLAASQQTLNHLERMAAARGSSAMSSPPISPPTDVQLCDDQGCVQVQYSRVTRTAKLPGGRTVRCRERRGKLTCPVEGRNMQGRVEH